MVGIYPNGGAGGPVQVLRGKCLAHAKYLDARQWACLAAAVRLDEAVYQPTLVELARIFGVSMAYVSLAEKLSPAKRWAIILGCDATPFATLRRRQQQHQHDQQQDQQHEQLPLVPMPLLTELTETGAFGTLVRAAGL